MGQALLCRLKDSVAVPHGQEINGTAEGMKAVMDMATTRPLFVFPSRWWRLGPEGGPVSGG